MRSIIKNKITALINLFKNNKILLVTVISFAFGIFMMTHNLFHSALWGDEWCEWDFSQLPIFEKGWNLYYIVIHTYQPPLYNFIMHFWLKVSDSIVWFRIFNIPIGIVSLIALYKTINILCGKKLYACISIFILSCCYQWIYYVQECAEYCIMLMFLFLALLFWVKLEKNNETTDYFFFLLTICCSIYCQYGAAIVGIPLIIFAFVRNLGNFNNIKKFWKIISFFVIGGMTGIVLFYFFLRIQTERMQEVYGYQTSALSVDMIKKVPVSLGAILHWMLNLADYGWVRVLCTGFGILLLLISAHVIVKMWKTERVRTRILLIFLITYVFHYFLVKTWLYARGKFETRYSLFYLPVLLISIIVLLELIVRYAKEKITVRLLAAILGLNMIIACGYSFININKNWDKAYDDIIAKTWQKYVLEQGYAERVYFCGYPSTPIIYHLEKFGYDISETTINCTDLEITKDMTFDSEFWVWSTGWSNENYGRIIVEAENRGYSIEIFHDYSSKGALAYCRLE